MQKYYVALLIRVGAGRALNCSMQDCVRSRLFPVIRVYVQADYQIAKPFGARSRFDFVRRSRFRIPEIGRAKEPGAASGERFDQSLSRIEFEFRDPSRNLTELDG